MARFKCYQSIVIFHITLTPWFLSNYRNRPELDRKFLFLDTLPLAVGPNNTGNSN